MKLLYSLTGLALSLALLTSCSQTIDDSTVSSTSPVERNNFITIGTSGVTGTYYPTGGAICRMVKMSETPFRCTVEATGGSVDNIETIGSGDFDFGMSQSDTAYQAYLGTGKFDGKPVEDLRSVMAIYPELLALVVRDDANISTLEDIKGKRINIDVAGSGSRMTTELLMSANDINLDELASVNEFKSSEGPVMLKNNNIDGYFGMFGHPTANIEDATNSVDIKLVPIYGTGVNKLVVENPYYSKGMIMASDYPGVHEDIPSFGVKAVLMTRADVNPKAIAAITQAVLDNFDEFKELHPAYKHITKASLLEGMAVPQHPAASAVFKEAGIEIESI